MSSEKNVIGIKFGVLGRGSISGDSGARILRQLTEIITVINREPPRFKIKLGLDQNYFKRQVSQLSKQINAQVHNIKITNQIGQQGGSGGNTKEQQLKETNAYKELVALTKERYRHEEKLIALRHKGSEALSMQKDIFEESQRKLSAATEELQPRLSDEQNTQLEQLNQRLEEQLHLRNALAKQQDEQAAVKHEISFKGAKANAESLLERYRDLIKHNREAAQEAEKLQKALSQDLSKEPERAAEQIRNLANANKEASASFSRLTVEHDTFFTRFRKAFQSKFLNALSWTVLGTATMALRQIYQNVLRLDEALTQLRIVTRSSEKAFQEFSRTAARTASDIGASFEDLIRSTTVFARLGYSMSDALRIAELATIYSKVAATNINEASRNITAVLKAFDINANELERVLDQFVHIGNTFAVTSEEIGRAMNNAASALVAAGNTLQESLGILTAANTTIQNINISSTAVRTMAARITRSSAELQEMGEDVGNILSTARLHERMMEFGVAIVDANGELRSTFDILRDISRVWDSLGSQDQAAVAEMIAGTRIQNAFFSIMQNWEDAESIVKNAGDAYGSLRRAQEEYINSIEGKLNRLRATWEEFSMTLLDSAFIKFFIDALRLIATVLNKVISLGNGIVPTIALVTTVMWGLHVVIKKIIAAYGAKAIAQKGLIAVTIAHTKALLANLKAGMLWLAKNPYLYLVVLVSMALTAQRQWTKIVTVIVAGAIAIGTGIAMGVRIAKTSIKAFMATNPLGWILLAITAVVVAITSLVRLIRGPSLQDLKESAKQAKEAWQALRNELDDVNSRLEETAERIEVLMELSRRRQLSLVEQNELDRLKEYNAQLTQMQQILYAQERAARDNAAKAAARASGGILGRDNLSGSAGRTRGFVTGLTFGISDLFGYGAIAESRRQNSLGGSGTDADRVARLLADWGNTTQAQQDFVEGFIRNLREQESQLTYFANATEQWQRDVNAAYKQVWEMLDRYTIAATPDGFSTVWNSLLVRENFRPATNGLRDLANAGEVTGKSLRELYDTNADSRAFIAYLIRLGQFSWDSSQSVNALVRSINDLYSSRLFTVTRLSHVDIIEDTQEAFDKLARALQDIQSLGVVSADVLRELLESYTGLDRFFQQTSQGFKLADEFADMTVLGVLERFATEELQRYVDRLSLAEKQLWEVQLAADGSSRSNDALKKSKEAVANAQENLNTAMETFAIHLRSHAIAQRTDELNEQREVLREQLEAYKDLINIRRDLLRTYRQEVNYQKELARRQRSVVDLQTQLSLARMDTSAAGRSRVRELEAQLAAAQESLDDFTLERAIEVLTNQLDNEFREYQKLIESEVDRIVEAIENLARDLRINMADMVPDATENLWKNKLQDELRAAKAILGTAQTNQVNANNNANNAQSTFNDAQQRLNNVSGWDRFWNTSTYRNARSARNEAQSMVSHTQDSLVTANRELQQAQAEVDRINRLMEQLLQAPTRHTGGFVNAPVLKSNESFAKLLRSEFVVTPQQMDSFMRKTLPTIASTRGGAVINSPLVNLSIANVTQETLPDVKKIVASAVETIKREFDSNFARTGQKRQISTFSMTKS